MKAEVLSFLDTVWGLQMHPDSHGEIKDYFFVAWKEGDSWRQKSGGARLSEWAYQNRGKDLYFCPNSFSEPYRRNEVAYPSCWLYSDLDEVDPRGLDIQPTVWWETSKGRFQCLWLLNRSVKPEYHSRLNQKLNYYCNADKNGFPLAKMLRVPGSYSTKHGGKWRIEDYWNWHVSRQSDDGVGDSDVVHDPKKIWAQVRYEVTPTQALNAERYDIKPEQMKRGNKLISQLSSKRHQARFRQRQCSDRSKYVWMLAKIARDQNFKPKQAAIMVCASPIAQDKYAGRLVHEVSRTVQKVYAEPRGRVEVVKERPRLNGKLELVSGERLLAQAHKAPSMLIDRFWVDEGYGFLVGEPKTYKSTAVLDLAYSIATGTKAFGTFNVGPAGHVIFIQEEDKPGSLQDRLMKLAASRGRIGSHYRRALLKPDPINMSFLNNRGFQLTDETHLKKLAEWIKRTDARLVVIDPWYLTSGVDENSADAVTPVLSNLKMISHELGVSIILIHHTRKPSRDEPPGSGDPHSMSGSGVLWRWCQSFVMLERRSDNEVAIYAKHKTEPPDAPILVEFDIGEFGSLRYETKVTDTREVAHTEYDQIKELVAESPGITVLRLAQEMGWGTPKMRRKVERSNDLRIEVRGGSSPGVFLR